MRKNRAALCTLAISCVLGLASACTEKNPPLSAADREQIRTLVSTQAPHPQHALDVEFEDRVRLIGYDLSSASIRAGEPFTVTWYWQVKKPLGAGWSLFTHAGDAQDTARLNLDAEGTIRRIYQPGRWEKDQYIKDAQIITLPADWNSSDVTLFLGFWKDERRLDVTKGEADDSDRARVLTLPVAAATANAAPVAPVAARSLNVAFAPSAIVLDGKLDEPAWVGASTTGAFVDTVSGGSAALRASAKVLWDETNLYIGFEVEDHLLKTTPGGRDARLWENDAVEIMIDPDGDNRNYFEIQVSPTGQIFDTFYDARRQPFNDQATPPVFGHMDWNGDIRAQVSAQGTANDGTEDHGYVVEIVLPWSALHYGETTVAPPQAGMSYRMNFYAMDANESGQTAAGWSPVRVPDFHFAAGFGRLNFVRPAGEEGTAPTPTPTTMPMERVQKLIRMPELGRNGRLPANIANRSGRK